MGWRDAPLVQDQSAWSSAPLFEEDEELEQPAAPPSALERIQAMSPREQIGAGGRTAAEFAGRALLAPVGAVAGLLSGIKPPLDPNTGQRAGYGETVGNTMRAVQGLIPKTLGAQAVGELAQQGVSRLPQGAQDVIGSAGRALQGPNAQPFIATADVLGAGAAARPLMRGAAGTAAAAAAAAELGPAQIAAREIQAQGGAVPRSALMDGTLVQRAQRAGRDTLSGELATKKINEQLAKQNRGVFLQKAGIKADRATPEVLNDARERIGNEFNVVYDRDVDVPRAPIDAALDEIGQNMPIAEGSRNAVAEAAKKVTTSLENGNGVLSGTAAKELRAWLLRRRETAIRGQAMDAADSLDDMIDSIDDAVFNASPPETRFSLEKARREWRNLKAIEAATDRGTSGEISYRKLASYLARNKFTRRAYAANEPGSFEALARAFYELEDKFPNSGTASRSMSVAEPAAIIASGGASLPFSGANMALQRYLAGPAGPSSAPPGLLAGPNPAAVGTVGLLGLNPYEERR